MNDALILAVHVEQVDAEFFTVLLERLKLDLGVRIEQRKIAVSRGNGVIHYRESEFRAANRAAGGLQSSESLRRSGFVNEVAIDVDDRWLTGFFVNNVGIPYFFVQCARWHAFSSCLFEWPGEIPTSFQFRISKL